MTYFVALLWLLMSYSPMPKALPIGHANYGFYVGAANQRREVIAGCALDIFAGRVEHILQWTNETSCDQNYWTRRQGARP